MRYCNRAAILKSEGACTVINQIMTNGQYIAVAKINSGADENIISPNNYSGLIIVL